MEQKATPLINQGMNRDLSVSKTGQSSAYENHNIRITARDNDTLLSVTNERGTKEINLYGQQNIEGSLIGWNVLNNHIILFTHSYDEATNNEFDRIYRIDYDGTNFENVLLFGGDLNFDDEHPIESVVYQETEDIQKIYWVDGKNVLRFMNFMASRGERARWNSTSFDSNRVASFTAKAVIEKDNSGNTRANGVAQYFLTYYNIYGQETGYTWVSDLVYLSPLTHGGSADGTNTNRVIITFTGMDTSYTHYRLYSIFRSSINGTVVGYHVTDGKTHSGEVTIVDDGAHVATIEATELLYLGSQPVIAGTLEHKDQTLFLGDLKSVGRGNIYKDIEETLQNTMFEQNTAIEGRAWEAKDSCIQFIYSDDSHPEISDIPYIDDDAIYPYNCQLLYSSGSITTFKGGEKYRFALKFQLKDGAETEAFWIGDKENTLYPVIDTENNVIKRVVVKCTLPKAVVTKMKEFDFKTVQLTIAEATYADRSVKAQGIVNPTMFNVWERYNSRLYSMPSWISRPRNSGVANRHFQVVKNSLESTGEIDCNYWPSDGSEPIPYFAYKNFAGSSIEYLTDYSKQGMSDFDCIMLAYTVIVDRGNALVDHAYVYAAVHIFRVYAVGHVQGSVTDAKKHLFTLDELDSIHFDSGSSEGTVYRNGDYSITYQGSIRFSPDGGAWTSFETRKKSVWSKIIDYLKENDLEQYYVPYDTFSDWAEDTWDSTSFGGWYSNYYNFALGGEPYTDKLSCINGGATTSPASEARWLNADSESVATKKNRYLPASYSKQYMFVDENVVTLNSPEIEYEAVSLDNAGYKFRVVGVARITSGLSDYVVDAVPGHLPGNNLVSQRFQFRKNVGSINGLTSWPLWKENGLKKKNDVSDITDVSKRDSTYYDWDSRQVSYWLRLWNKTGIISGYTDEEDKDYSLLKSKTIGNLRFSHETIYGEEMSWVPQSIRVFNQMSSQYLQLRVGNDTMYYDGYPKLALSCPGSFKYPILFSGGSYDSSDYLNESEESAYLYSKQPIVLDYASGRHAVISLPTTHEGKEYTQTVLPYIFESEKVSDYIIETPDDASAATADASGPLLPWLDDDDIPYVYVFNTTTYPQPTFVAVGTESLNVEYISLHYYSDTSFGADGWYRCLRQANADTVAMKELYGVISTADYTYLVNTKGYRFSIDNDAPDGIYRLNLDDAKVLCCWANAGTEYPPAMSINYISVALNLLHTRFVCTFEGYRTLSFPGGSISIGSLSTYPFLKYIIDQSSYTKPERLTNKDQYLYIGEIYQDYAGTVDSRYGGISASAVENCRFITAGPQYPVERMPIDSSSVIYGNQGDTYFQRWDSLKTTPRSVNDANGIIDITSVMLETHINIEGRTDLQRGIDSIASIDTTTFGQINPVYSQDNNFFVSRDLDDELNTDAYRSHITWSLSKADLSDIDAWTHVTLASTLKLDSDKGICRALRRFQNRLIAFQDRAISEVLFNSRTQLSTQDGVPVELANSGRVDGKRYLTNKYGVVNKWSIIEGKSGLYFVDNINKAFCAAGISERGSMEINNLSEKLHMGSWFRKINSIKTWTPDSFDNVVSFYDRVHSDVYLLKKDNSEGQAALVYNEIVGVFTGFFDYVEVPMMTNLEDRFVSFKNNKLWFQNEGLFCNFFGQQYDYWVQYRVTPEPYSDKIWTNIDFRADFYRSLDENGDAYLKDIDDFDEADYQDAETFDYVRVWNEYQTTGKEIVPPVKKFKIWRYIIPRAASNSKNIHSLDRIRSPWVNILMKKSYDDDSQQNQDLMQLHDVTVKYFE